MLAVGIKIEVEDKLVKIKGKVGAQAETIKRIRGTVDPLAKSGHAVGRGIMDIAKSKNVDRGLFFPSSTHPASI